MNLFDAHRLKCPHAIAHAETNLLVAVYRENGWNRFAFAVEPRINKTRRQRLITKLREEGYS